MKYKEMSKMVCRYACPFPNPPKDHKSEEELQPTYSIDEDLYKKIIELDWYSYLPTHINNKKHMKYSYKINQQYLKLEIIESINKEDDVSYVPECVEYNVSLSTDGIYIKFKDPEALKIVQFFKQKEKEKEDKEELQNKQEMYKILCG